MLANRFSGVGRSIKALRGYNKNMGAAMERGVHKAMEYLFQEVLKVTPIATGELRKSGKTQYTGRLKNCKGRVTFSAPYAIYVHENLDKRHAEGTHAKFISRTAFEKRGQMNKILWAEVTKARMPK